MTERSIVLTPPSFDEADLGRCLLHVVLVHPEIPQNTGSIARLCAATRAWLHLVEPLGFALEDRYLRRAGLDYWPGVRLSVHASLSSFDASLGRRPAWVFTKKARTLHTNASYRRGDVLVFGRETTGLPGAWVAERDDRALRFPTSGEVRSLNLASATAIATYELLRQIEWDGEEPMPSDSRPSTRPD